MTFILLAGAAQSVPEIHPHVGQLINSVNWAAVSAIGACLAALFSLIVTVAEKTKDRVRRKPRIYITKVDPKWVSGEQAVEEEIGPVTMKITNSGAETIYDVDVTFHNDKFFSAFRKFTSGGPLAQVGRETGLTVADTNDSFLIESSAGRYQASRRTLPLKHALYPADSTEFEVAKPYTELLMKYLQLMSHGVAATLPPAQYLQALDEAPTVGIEVGYTDMYDKTYADKFELRSQLAVRGANAAMVKGRELAAKELRADDLMIVLSIKKTS